jgi:hypothetical protein
MRCLLREREEAFAHSGAHRGQNAGLIQRLVIHDFFDWIFALPATNSWRMLSCCFLPMPLSDKVIIANV